MATYFLNSEWAVLTAGTVVEVTGGTAVIGTDAFASAEGLTVAAGDTVAYEGGTFDSIYSAEGVTARINKNITYTGDTLTLSGITVNADTIDTAAAVITFTGDASSFNVNYGMVTVLGGTTAGGYVVDGDLYIKNNVYYNDSTFTEETTTVDVGGATFATVWGGTSYSADKTLYNFSASADVYAFASKMTDADVVVIVGDGYTLTGNNTFTGGVTSDVIVSGATLTGSGRYHFAGGTISSDVTAVLSDVELSTKGHYLLYSPTYAKNSNEAYDLSVRYDNVVALNGETFTRGTVNMPGGTINVDIVNSQMAWVGALAGFNAGCLNLAFAGTTITSGVINAGTTAPTAESIISGDATLIISDGSYIKADVVGGHKVAGGGSFNYSVGGNVVLTVSNSTVDSGNVIWGTCYDSTSTDPTTFVVKNDVVVTIDNSSVGNVYATGSAVVNGNVSVSLVNGATVSGYVKGYYTTENVTGAITLTVTGANSVSDEISNFDEINISAGATLTAASIAHTGTITIDVANITESGSYKIIDVTDASTFGTVKFANAGSNITSSRTDENGDLWVDVTVIDTETVYFNNQWTGADDGIYVTLADGGKAVWGVNAFSDIEAAKTAAGDKVINIDGGVYDEAIGLTDLVITGDVTINDWSGVDTITVKNGATITTNSWDGSDVLTVDLANASDAPVIDYTGSGEVTFGKVNFANGNGAAYAVNGKLYAGSNVIYNNPAYTGDTEIALGGVTFTGTFETNVFNKNAATAINDLSGAEKITVLSGCYDTTDWSRDDFRNYSKTIIFDGVSFKTTGTKARVSLFCSGVTGKLYAAVRNSTITNLNRFYLLHGVNTTESVTIDFDKTTAQAVYIGRSGETVKNLTVNVSNKSSLASIEDGAVLTVNGDLAVNVAGSTVGYIKPLTKADSSAEKIAISIDNSTVGVIDGYDIITDSSLLTVKGTVTAGAISGFDTITISAGATLTATSIAARTGTITIDVSKYSGNVRVIDIDNASSFGTVNLINAGSNEASWNTDENGDLWVNVTVIDTETVYFNNQWTGADDGIYVILSDGNKAVWGVNAFSDIEAAKTAAGDKVIHIDGGVYDEAIGLTDLVITGDVTINDWSGVDTITVKNGATITTNSWDGSDVLTVDLANASDAPVIDYTGSGEVTFGKVNFANGNGAAYAVNGKLYAGSNVIYNNPAYTGDTEIVMGGVTFTGVYGENIFSYTDVNSLNGICGADKVTVFTGEYASTVWSGSGFNPSGNITVFDGATVTTGGNVDTTNRLYLARGSKGGADVYGAIINSDMSKLYYSYAMYNLAECGDLTVDISGSTLNHLHLTRSSGVVENFTINVSGSTFTGAISDTGNLTVSGELNLNISGSSVAGTINLMTKDATNISKITVALTNSTVNNIYACDAGKVDVSQDELILKGTNVTGTIDNFETVTITAGSVVKAHKLSAGTINVTLGEITEDIRIIDTGRSLKGTLNITNQDALPAGFELIQFNGDLWAVNTSDPTKVIGREVTVGEIGSNDAFENVTIANTVYGAKADAGAVNVAFSMNNTVAKSIVGGGNNSNAVIGTISVNLTDTTFNTFYGGGYNHTTGAIEVNLDSVLAKKMVYGGNVVNSNNSKNSTVSTVDSVSLTISGGRFEDQVVGGGRVVASASGTTTEVSSVIGEVDFTVTSDAAGFSAVFNESVFGAGYVIGNHADTTAELYVGKVRMVLNGMIMNDVADKVSDGIYGGGLAAGKAVLTVGGVQPFAVEEADEAVCITVESGSYTSIYGGGWAESKATVTVYGVSIEVLDGNIADLYGGGNNDKSGARTYIEGDVFISIGGGSIDNIHAGAKYGTSRVNGSSTVQIAGTAKIGNIYGWTQTGADSVKYDQILDVDAALSCNSISHFDIIDIASGKDIDIASAFDLSGVELNIAEQADAWDVLCATELTGLADALVTLNGQEAAWNSDNNRFASTDYTLTVQENTVDDKTTYSLVFGKLA